MTKLNIDGKHRAGTSTGRSIALIMAYARPGRGLGPADPLWRSCRRSRRASGDAEGE